MDETDNIILSRISLKKITSLIDDEYDNDSMKKSPLTNDERKWRLSYLRNQFESFKLQNLFKVYTEKVNHGYFSVFLILQCLLSTTHFVFLISSNLETLETVLPDLILYGGTVIFSLIDLYLVDRVVEKCKKLRFISLLYFGTIVFVNYLVPYYHGFVYGRKFRPAYTGHLILACYLFIGLDNVNVATGLGATLSLFHIFTLFYVTYSNDGIIWKKLLSDAIFVLFMNGLGIYYRYMNEIVIRRSFLDRRDSIMSTLQLRHEEEQVDQLMRSIIPHYVISKVKKRYINATKAFIKHGKLLRENLFDNSLLDEHEKVSILFADIVNYTEMTSKLKITDLLDTLNELFCLFDDTSEKLKVTRIKFLGDCYYCVSGLPPEPAPNPAEACVDLGLEMISIISSVRRKRDLNVNMRIGVHSGKILSGIIGSVKYQFDIWSKDVDIANKMESEGVAGMVHITDKTKSLLKKPYIIEPTDKGETCLQFKVNGIQTYLVRPTDKLVANKSESAPSTPNERPFKFRKQRSLPNGTALPQLQRIPSLVDEESEDQNLTFIDSQIRYQNNENKDYRKRISSNGNNIYYKASDLRRSTSAWKRRTAFMNNNIKRFSERTEKVNQTMEEAINEISFSKYDQYVKVKEINPMLLFNDFKTELEYIQIPDALFKYYLISAVLLIFCVYCIQNITLIRWDATTWPFLITALPVILIFVPVSWAEYLYNKYIASYTNEIPKNVFLRIICKCSNIIANCVSVRLIIFLSIYLGFSICVFNEMIECRTSFDAKPDTNLTQTNLIVFLFSKFTGADQNDLIKRSCVLPWHMTETCSMTVIMGFLFLRIFIWIKLILGSIAIGIYAFCVLSFSKGYYMESETINYNFSPQWAHIISTVFLTITLHLVDRQTDYMNRLDYLVNRTFKTEQEEANILQKVNENLLVNILPKHVAVLYLDVNREQKDLYYEEHNNVAVMFASIITDNELQDILDEREFLLLMNSYITEFDILTNRKEFQNIEKIKIAKWTYMVACGLFPGGRRNDVEKHQTCSSLETILNFASEMFKKVENVNKSHFQRTTLRIGICHGQIAAGIVGNKKPLYDIWGDPVNMASRMDSTGMPKHIQVMENTAEIIQKIGYRCEERGYIKVKGKEELLKTFFVNLDKNFNLVRVS